MLDPLTDATVINCRVAVVGAVQQQRSVGRGRDFIGSNPGAVLHVGAVCSPEGEQQVGTLSCWLPVPAECGGGVVGSGGGVQQGAAQGGVLTDSHLYGGGLQGCGTGPPAQTSKTEKLEARLFERISII